jgi:hypothetical protein
LQSDFVTVIVSDDSLGGFNVDRRFDYRIAGIRGQPRKRPKTLRCGWCKEKFKVAPHGRLPEFCSHSCRQRAYEKKRWQRPSAIEALAKDLATVKVHNYIRAEIWALLKAAGVVSQPDPPPPPPKPRRRSHLRLVK